MSTLQIRVDDAVKRESEALFSELGLDISTAVRIFLKASIAHAGIPFAVRQGPSKSLREAMNDSLNGENLTGPFDSAQDAVNSMLA